MKKLLFLIIIASLHVMGVSQDITFNILGINITDTPTDASNKILNNHMCSQYQKDQYYGRDAFYFSFYESPIRPTYAKRDVCYIFIVKPKHNSSKIQAIDVSLFPGKDPANDKDNLKKALIDKYGFIEESNSGLLLSKNNDISVEVSEYSVKVTNLIVTQEEELRRNRLENDDIMTLESDI